jgi:hypothetical protein
MADQAQTPDEQDAPASARLDPTVRGTEIVDDHIETVRLRRVPKYSVFLVLGAALGVLVALILTFAFNGSGTESPNTGLVYTQGQVFGFVALICVTVGVALGGVTALTFDRVLSRRTRAVIADRERVRLEE